MNRKPPELQLGGGSATRCWNHKEIVMEVQREERYCAAETQITHKIVTAIIYNLNLQHKILCSFYPILYYEVIVSIL
jgi:hypothetical protein